MESFDKEVEFALMNGMDPSEHVARLTAEECDECFHPVSDHGSEGCTHNRHFETDGIESDGPCGCTAVTVEVEA